MEHVCEHHGALAEDIQLLVRGQIQMQEQMSGIGVTLLKLEDTNIQIVALRGEVAALDKNFERNEKAHDEIFIRMRVLEDVGCSPRLKSLEAEQGQCPAIKKVEARQEKMLWGGVVTVGLAFLATLLKVAWK